MATPPSRSRADTTPFANMLKMQSPLTTGVGVDQPMTWSEAGVRYGASRSMAARSCPISSASVASRSSSGTTGSKTTPQPSVIDPLGHARETL